MNATARRRRAESPKLEDLSIVAERVRAAGLKVTPQRVAIVRELTHDPTHPTAQELYERLRPTNPSMSFATVYNTLDALAAKGLCAGRSMSPGPTRFDPNMEPHDHAVCDRCGLVRDVHAPRGRADAGVSAPEGFVVRTVEQVVRGLCAACASTDRPATKRRTSKTRAA
ncbi:MAG: transcriptional repressor [Polyangiaceae bacterium]